MEELPSDITRLLIHELDANDLSDYCSANREIKNRCGDKIFWNDKVRTMEPRRLEEDWLIPLAIRGDEYLLNWLLDAIMEAKIVINEWAITACIVALEVLYQKVSSTKQRLYRMVDRNIVMKKYLHTPLALFIEEINRFRSSVNAGVGKLTRPPRSTIPAIQWFIVQLLSSSLYQTPSPTIIHNVLFDHPRSVEGKMTIWTLLDLFVPYHLYSDHDHLIKSYLFDIDYLMATTEDSLAEGYPHQLKMEIVSRYARRLQLHL